MNCQQFTSFIVEVARGQMLDATARDSATSHAETCQACAAHLAQEHSLTTALRTVAQSMRDLSAPARSEAKLLAAFQESFANAKAATINSSPEPVSLQARVFRQAQASSRRSRRIAAVAIAIAASLVLVVLATLYRQFTQTPPAPEITRNSEEPDSNKPSPANASTSPTLPPMTTTTELVRQPKLEQPYRKHGMKSQPAPSTLARAATPRMITARQVIDGGSAIIEASEGKTTLNGAGGVVKPDEAESVTEFISLVGGAPAATPLEGGQLVRVQLPRAALASLGLPLNGERGGNEPVKADVLLGNDGLARAIRFVR